MFPQHTTRTFRSFVLRALAVRALVFAACASVLVIGHVVALGRPGHVQVAITEQVTRDPSWTMDDAASFPGCVPSSRWPAGTPAPVVVVQAVTGPGHRKIDFGAAWELNHDATHADDVWVLGVCP